MGYLEDKEAARQATVAQPVAPAGTSPYLRERQAALSANAYAQTKVQTLQPEKDRDQMPAYGNPVLSNSRYTKEGDMNAVPRPQVDDRVEDETWADAVKKGTVSIAGSFYEALGNTVASIPEAFAQGQDALILAASDDERDREYLRDIVRREKEFGMRSEWASAITNATRLQPEDVVEGFWTRDLPSAVGYSAAFIAGGLPGMAVKVPVWLSTAALGGTVGASSFYQDALQSGATSEQAATAYGIGALVGPSEAAPIFRVFDRLDKYSGGILGKAIQGRMQKFLGTSATGVVENSVARTLLKEGAKGAFEEALQETFQEGMLNWTAKEFVGYDPERSLGQNLGKAAETGGAVGFLLSTLAAGLGLKMKGTPIESEVDRRAREATGFEELTLGRLQDMLLLRQNEDSALAEGNALEIENKNRLNSLPQNLRADFARKLRLFTDYKDDTDLGLDAPVHQVGVEPKLAKLMGYSELGQPRTYEEWALDQSNQLGKIFIIPPPIGSDVETAAKVNKGGMARMGNLVKSIKPVLETFLKKYADETGIPYKRVLLLLDNSEGKLTSGGHAGTIELANGERMLELYVSPKFLKLLVKNPGVQSARGFVTAFTHELGHHLVYIKLRKMIQRARADISAGATKSKDVKQFGLIAALYKKAILDIVDPKRTHGENLQRTDYVTRRGIENISTALGITSTSPGDQFMMLSPTEGNIDTELYKTAAGEYYANAHEFVANLFAQYASGAFTGKTLLDSLGLPKTAEYEWLENSFNDLRKFYQDVKIDPTNAMFGKMLETEAAGKKFQQSFSDPVVATFLQGVFSGVYTPEQALKAYRGWNTHLDKFNTIWKWGATLLQLERVNKHIQPLVRYLGLVQQWDAFKKKLEANSLDLIGEAKSLGKERSNRLFNAIIDETIDGKFMEADIRGSLFDVEMEALYQKIRKHFTTLLNHMEEVTVAQIKANVTDALAQTQKLAEARQGYAKMKSKPYFPLMRFGRFSVTVQDIKTGKIDELHMFESEAEQQEAVKELRAQQPKGKSVGSRELKDFELSSIGLPFEFLSTLENSFEQMGKPLSPEQKQIMKELSYDFLPSRSFLKKFKRRKATPGYSTDGMRILGAYTQNAIGYIARAKYGLQMKEQIADLEQEGKLINRYAPDDVKDQSKRFQIANYMTEHLQYIMEPAGEWAGLRGLGFIYYLGYNVKSAVINLTQVPFVTYPYLASRFGDVKAVAAITRANALMVKYWKNPDSLSEEEHSLLHRGRVEGWLDESLASEIALIAQDGVLDRVLPLDAKGRFRSREFKKLGRHTYSKIAHWGALPFHFVEKLNRNVTALAAYQLSREAGGDIEGASIAARDAVQLSQFEYSRWARAKFTRGKKGALFLFKSYLQGTLFFLYNDPGAWRYITMLAVVGGLQGLPFADDLLDLIEGLGTPVREYLGIKDPKLDLRTEMRKDVAEMLGDLDVNPDIFFHGISSQSMGLGLIGEALGIPIPNVDLSGSLSLGNVIPGTQLLKRAGTAGTSAELVGQAVEDIGGPLGAAGMGVIAPWVRDDPNAWRRWERALPLFMRGASKALRISAAGGKESTAGGEIIANFDLNDPRDVGELILQSIGFTPRKVAKGWARYIAQLEVTGYWMARKSKLMAEYNRASEIGDREGIADAMLAVKEYNRQVPYPEMTLGAKDIRRSNKQYLIRRKKMELGIALQQDFIRLREDYARAYGEIPEEDNLRTPPTAPFGTASGNVE